MKKTTTNPPRPSKVDSSQQNKRGRSVAPKPASPLKVPTPSKAPSSEKEKRERTPSKVYNAPDDSACKKRAKPTTRQNRPASPKDTTLKAASSPQPTIEIVASPPKTPTVSSAPKAATPLVTSPPKSQQAPPKIVASPPKTNKIFSPPKAATPLVASPPKTQQAPRSTPLTPVVVGQQKFPPPPGRPAHLPAKAKATDAGQALIHQITASTDMSNKTLSCRVNSVISKVLTAKATCQPINYLEMVLSQVNSSIGCQVWLGDKTPHMVFKRMPEENHIVQISRVHIKKSTYDAARYNEVMLSANEKINIHIVDDEETVIKCPFVYDPILLNVDGRSQSVSTTASLPIPELN